MTLSLRLAHHDQPEEWELSPVSMLRDQAPNSTLTISSCIYFSSSFNNIISQASSLPTHQLHNSLTPRCLRLKREVQCNHQPGDVMRWTKRTVCQLQLDFKKRKKIHNDENKTKQMARQLQFQKLNKNKELKKSIQTLNKRTVNI